MSTLEARDASDNPVEKYQPPRIPLRRYPLVSEHNGIIYEVHKVVRGEIMDGLRRRTLPFEKEFGYDNPFLIHDKVRHYVREGGEVVFARTSNRDSKYIGVVTQEIRRALIDTEAGQEERRVLSIGIRVVLEDYQNHGIGRHFAEEAIQRLRPDVVTGEFRTWRIPRMYQDTGYIGSMPPLAGDVTPEVQEVLEAVLDRGVLARTDLRTLISLGAFPKANDGRFTPPNSNERAMSIYNRIKELGVDPASGDTIRYYAIVDQEAVDAAIAGITRSQSASVGGRSVRGLFGTLFLTFLR